MSSDVKTFSALFRYRELFFYDSVINHFNRNALDGDCFGFELSHRI